MEKVYTDDEVFKGVDYTVEILAKGDYDNCLFDACNFANMDLSGVSFVECLFVNCDLSMVALSNTTLNSAHFDQCKMLGIRFEHCNPFSLSFSISKSILNYCSFYKMKMKGFSFKDCSFHEVDFSEADLSSTIFDRCDLLRAVFDRSNLEKADFRLAYNYSIDPSNNRVAKAKFSMPAAIGLLDKYNIIIE